MRNTAQVVSYIICLNNVLENNNNNNLTKYTAGYYQFDDNSPLAKLLIDVSLSTLVVTMSKIYSTLSTAGNPDN